MTLTGLIIVVVVGLVAVVSDPNFRQNYGRDMGRALRKTKFARWVRGDD